MKRVKLMVGTRIWLVPPGLVGAAFMRALNKLRMAADGEEVDWTEEEEKAFIYVNEHPDVWKPL